MFTYIEELSSNTQLAQLCTVEHSGNLIQYMEFLNFEPPVSLCLKWILKLLYLKKSNRINFSCYLILFH